MVTDPLRLLIAIGITIAYVVFTIRCLRRPLRRRNAVDGVEDVATLVTFASQTGFAEQLAAQTAKSLGGAAPVRLAALSDLGLDQLARSEQALFIVSTTGEGDAPDPAAAFVRSALNREVDLHRLRYGVLALGDREYDNYCAFGHRIDVWLRHQGAQPLFDVIEVDNGDEGALRHWQHQLAVLSGSPDQADWETPRYERWRLAERIHVNPGSAGDACHRIVLMPVTGSVNWQAGDIAEIDPHNSTWTGAQALPHREYSIASIPEDGAIHLLVREMHRENGEPGLGSTWLSRGAPLGAEIALRIRANSNFHAPADDRPMILIGNGTGIAGLRSHIKARIAAGRHRNWLIFGERNAACDRFYAEDLERWLAQGQLERLDQVFSRDQSERRYVQHRLLECAAVIREWVLAGAAIYVCGSLKGMAPGVDATLAHILGADLFEQLALERRYRRDVY
jgi:sulfite reductase (NADPH) flavoprotein alpha-component